MKLNEKERLRLFVLGRDLSPQTGDLFQNEMEITYEMILNEIDSTNDALMAVESQHREYHTKLTKLAKEAQG